MPQQTWSVTVGAVTEDCVIPAGSYYLDDPVSALSFCDAIVAALNTHTTIAAGADPTCVIAQNRHIRIAWTGAFSITFTDTLLRDVLGFTGNLSAASAYQATHISDYLWVPGKPESPDEAILGVNGRKIKDTRIGQSGLDGRVVSRHNDTRIVNRFWWQHIVQARYWTSSELGGEWQTWWDVVASSFLRWKLYRDVTDDDGSTSDMSLGSTFLGPYKMRAPREVVDFDMDRSVPNMDSTFGVELPAVVVPEYA